MTLTAVTRVPGHLGKVGHGGLAGRLCYRRLSGGSGSRTLSLSLSRCSTIARRCLPEDVPQVRTPGSSAEGVTAASSAPPLKASPGRDPRPFFSRLIGRKPFGRPHAAQGRPRMSFCDREQEGGRWWTAVTPHRTPPVCNQPHPHPQSGRPVLMATPALRSISAATSSCLWQSSA